MVPRRTRSQFKCRSLLFEALERRNLLSVNVIAKTATFTDVDGDVVTIAVTAGSLSSPGVFTTATVGPGDQLQVIDLTAVSFEGTNLSITVKRVATGDGLVNIGYINATGRNLGTVTVAGDVGQIDAGTGQPVTPAIKSLTVNSLGRLGLDSQGGSGSLASNINGNITTLTAKTDIQEAFILVNGSIGSMTLGGSLRGGSAASSGCVITTGSIKSVKIGGDIVGGQGQNSGMVYGTGAITKVTVGGSIIGGSGDHSGFVSSQSTISSLAITGSLLGGTGSNSAQISAVGKVGSLTIGGSVLGGTGDDSGAVLAEADIGTFKIGHDLIGGSYGGSVTLSGSGYVESGGRIGSVSIGGSIIAGSTSGGGTLTQNGSIRAADDIGSFSVKGSLVGNATNAVIISARGKATSSSSSDLAIGSASVTGRVEFATILAGYAVDLTPTNGDAQIGAVKVGGDWVTSILVAGIKNVASGNTLFGDGNDALIGVGKAGITASIASIKIGGNVFGTPVSTNSGDHFGLVAQKIGSLKIATISRTLTSGKDTVNLGPTLDVTLVEI